MVKRTIKMIFMGLIVILFLIGCNDENLEGNYVVYKKGKPFKLNSQYLIATLGKKNFSLNSGKGGTYEVSHNKVIVQGTFSHLFEIKENDLVSDKWTLKRSTQQEIELLQAKAKKEKLNNAPVIGDEQQVTRW